MLFRAPRHGPRGSIRSNLERWDLALDASRLEAIGLEHFTCRECSHPPFDRWNEILDVDLTQLPACIRDRGGLDMHRLYYAADELSSFTTTYDENQWVRELISFEFVILKFSDLPIFHVNQRDIVESLEEKIMEKLRSDLELTFSGFSSSFYPSTAQPPEEFFRPYDPTTPLVYAHLRRSEDFPYRAVKVLYRSLNENLVMVPAWTLSRVGIWNEHAPRKVGKWVPVDWDYHLESDGEEVLSTLSTLSKEMPLGAALKASRALTGVPA